MCNINVKICKVAKRRTWNPSNIVEIKFNELLTGTKSIKTLILATDDVRPNMIIYLSHIIALFVFIFISYSFTLKMGVLFYIQSELVCH